MSMAIFFTLEKLFPEQKGDFRVYPFWNWSKYDIKHENLNTRSNQYQMQSFMILANGNNLWCMAPFFRHTMHAANFIFGVSNY